MRQSDNYSPITVISSDSLLTADIPWEFSNDELRVSLSAGETLETSQSGAVTIIPIDGGVRVPNSIGGEVTLTVWRETAKTQDYSAAESHNIDTVALTSSLNKIVRMIQEQSTAIIESAEGGDQTGSGSNPSLDQVLRAGNSSAQALSLLGNLSHGGILAEFTGNLLRLAADSVLIEGSGTFKSTVPSIIERLQSVTINGEATVNSSSAGKRLRVSDSVVIGEGEADQQTLVFNDSNSDVSVSLGSGVTSPSSTVTSFTLKPYGTMSIYYDAANKVLLHGDL